MTYYTRNELAELTGVHRETIRKWEAAGIVHLAISHGEGKGRTILYDNNSLAQVRAQAAKEKPTETPSAAPEPKTVRPIVNVSNDPAIVELLQTISRDIRIEQEIARNRQAELLASLRTIAEELRALRHVWEAK